MCSCATGVEFGMWAPGDWPGVRVEVAALSGRCSPQARPLFQRGARRVRRFFERVLISLGTQRAGRSSIGSPPDACRCCCVKINCTAAQTRAHDGIYRALRPRRRAPDPKIEMRSGAGAANHCKANTSGTADCFRLPAEFSNRPTAFEPRGHTSRFESLDGCTVTRGR